MTRQFHLGDILSVTTGRLVSPRLMDALYDLLDYMTGDKLMTHQLPRACDECGPALLAQHPQLASVVVPDEFDGEAHVAWWLRQQTAAYGEQLPVEPLDPADHTHINPLTELRMMAPHMQIVPVVLDDGEPS